MSDLIKFANLRTNFQQVITDAVQFCFYLQSERMAAKAAAEAASKAASDHEAYKSQVAANDKSTSAEISGLKQELAVQKSQFEQSQETLALERSNNKDAQNAASNSSSELKRELEAMRQAAEKQRDDAGKEIESLKVRGGASSTLA